MKVFPAFAALIALLVVGNCRRDETPKTEAPPPLNSSLTPAPEAPKPQTVQLVAWASPVSGMGRLADHTWVTSYDGATSCTPQPKADYWYCTGACRDTTNGGPPGIQRLGLEDADLALAQCIAQPNFKTMEKGPATANIQYLVDGVCHQIANRVLFAGSSEHKLTVEGAHGYRVSKFVFGTYGTQSQWAMLQQHCGIKSVFAQSESDETRAMVNESLGRDVTPQAIMRVLQVRNDLVLSKKALDEAALSGTITGRVYAEKVNDLVNQKLEEIATLISADDYRRLFNLGPGERIDIADPSIAAEMKYARR